MNLLKADELAEKVYLPYKYLSTKYTHIITYTHTYMHILYIYIYIYCVCIRGHLLKLEGGHNISFDATSSTSTLYHRCNTIVLTQKSIYHSFYG